MATEEWKKHAYPLQLITIRLQGTRHSSLDSILSQLQEISDRVKAGEKTGESSDDDFGYLFEFNEPEETIFGDKPSSYK